MVYQISLSLSQFNSVSFIGMSGSPPLLPKHDIKYTAHIGLHHIYIHLHKILKKSGTNDNGYELTKQNKTKQKRMSIYIYRQIT